MFTLTSLFQAVQEAIVDANRVVEKNAYDMLFINKTSCAKYRQTINGF